jgi:hypothetical protein
MRTSLLLLSLAFSLSAHAEILPGMLYTKVLKGQDDHGSYNIAYLQISPKALPNDSARRPVNYALASLARGALCESNHAARKELDSQVDMKPLIANHDVLSVDMSQDSNCGAYPEAGITSLLFDLRTGKQVEELDSQMTDAKAFKDLVVAKVLENAPKQDVDQDCRDMYTKDELVTNVFNFSVREDRIIATQEYPHAANACAFDTEISFADIKALVKPGSTLSRIVK